MGYGKPRESPDRAEMIVLIRQAVEPPAELDRQRAERIVSGFREIDAAHGALTRLQSAPAVLMPVPDELDQVGQVAAHGRGASVKVDMGIEQLLAIKLDAMRGSWR
jgi:hypothetical protein